MKHLGDITKINGAAVEPVEVIIGGSPCQDLSVAGKRAGLNGERSGLFMEQIRITKEMRSADERNGSTHIRPRYMVFENVPGLFSSNKSEDFRIVLEEMARICEPSAVIPRPEKGKWTNAGAVVGDGWSIAWRLFDAQFWGVPQRRRRIALVADFGGATAPEILFERKGVFGNITQSGTPWKDFAAAIAKRFGSTNQAERGTDHLTYCIQGNSIDRFERHDKCQGVEVAPTVTAKYGTGGGNTPLVYDARGNGEGGTVPTITGDHQNRITDYTALAVGFPLGFRPENTRVYPEKCTTICNGTRPGSCNGVITIDRAAFNQGENAQYDFKVDDNGINSMVVSKGPSAVCSQSNVRRLTPLECERLQGFPTVRKVEFTKMTKDEYIAFNINEGNIIVDAEKGKVYGTRGPGGKKLSEPKELVGTILNGYRVVSIRNGQTKLQCRVHRIIWISKNGIIPDGYVVDHINNNKQDNRISNLQILTPKENSTKARKDGLYKTHEEAGQAKITNDVHDLIQYVYGNSDMSLRQLAEAFKISKSRISQIIHESSWTDIGEYTDTKGKKRKTSDSARYKALGNSIALPSWAWLLERLNRYCRYHTMASLFDGIGGFPLIWETLNGDGSCVWASEIEEFPIAVTKYHFGENI